ncbi:MAG: alpha/beta fold hydrolase [candidate division WOR-3 bacterium]
MKFIRFLLLTFALIAFSFALRPEREYKAIPSDYGIIYREVEFLTADNLKLKGWFIPAQDTVGILNSVIGRLVPVPDELKPDVREYKTDTTRKPTIIICDGDAGNMTQFIFYAYHFFTKGYNVFLFDWRGFGKSSDWQTEQDRLCYTEYIDDYDATIDFVKKQPEVDTTRIGVMGFSTGAYLSFAIIAKRNDISAYVGRALMSSFDELLPVLKQSLPGRNFMAPENYPEELLPINAAEKIKIPVFLIVGEKDNRTPVWMSEKIMVKLNGPKELWIVPKAEHGGINGPEFINYPEFFDRVLAFFDKYLKK